MIFYTLQFALRMQNCLVSAWFLRLIYFDNFLRGDCVPISSPIGSIAIMLSSAQSAVIRSLSIPSY